jgi:hypothetical protein
VTAPVPDPTPGPLQVVDGYGLGDAPADGSVLPWATVVGWLVAARSYWVTTTRADGRPHAMPVWGLWLDGALWFSTDPESVKGRNFAVRPDAVVHLESGDEVCILDGRVRRAPAVELPGSFVTEYAAKYDTELDVAEPSFGFYVLDARIALTWREVDYPTSNTRWTFA